MRRGSVRMVLKRLEGAGGFQENRWRDWPRREDGIGSGIELEVEGAGEGGREGGVEGEGGGPVGIEEELEGRLGVREAEDWTVMGRGSSG